MWDMFTNSMRLFMRGKLFREPHLVLRQWAIGFALTLLLFGVLAALRAPLWLAVLLASFVGGAVQPYLFKDLKYN